MNQENSKQDTAIAGKTDKTYGGHENCKQDTTIAGKADKKDVLLHDGSVNMSSNLNMNSKSYQRYQQFTNSKFCFCS